MCQLIYRRKLLFNNLKIKALLLKIALNRDNSFFLRGFICGLTGIKQQSQQMG